MNQVIKSKHWMPLLGTPDLFNGCGNGPSGVPQNDVGNQPAFSGRGYGGLVTREFASGYTESLQTPLVSKLDSGKLYYFEIFVSKGDVNILDDNSLSICLSSDATLNKKTIYPSNTYFKDKNGWTKFSFYFTAKGYEQVLTIGSFPTSGGPYSNDDHVDTTSHDLCYYYIDKLYLGDCPLGKLKPNLLGNDTTICSDSLINFRISAQVPYPNQSYKWSTGDTTAEITIKAIGKYIVTISNFSCTYTDTIEVKRMPFPKVNLGPDQTVCEEDPVKLTALNANASRYRWNDTSYFSTLTTKDSGIFWVDVTVKGCTTRDTVLIHRLPLPRFSLGNDSIVCHRLPFTLTPSKDTDQTSYRWSTSDTIKTIQVNQSGKYWLETKRLGCYFHDTIQLYFNALKPFSLGRDTFLCDTLPYFLDARGAASKSYIWSTNDSLSTQFINQSGIYWVKVSDSTCIEYDSIEISYREPPVLELGPDTIVCRNTTFVLDAKNTGASYHWSNGSTNKTLLVSQFGKYGVSVTLNGCVIQDSLFVGIEDPPVLELGNDTVMCKGDTLFINAFTPGSTYKWDDGWNQAIFPATYTDFFKVAVTRNHCTVRDSLKAYFFNKPKFDLGNDTLICTTSPVVLGTNIPFGYQYEWQNKSTQRTFTTDTSGLFWVKLNNNGCFHSDTILLNTYPPPEINLGNDTNVCPGTIVSLQAGDPNSSVLWSTGETSHSINIQVPKKVTVSVLSQTGCSNTDEIQFDTFTVEHFTLGNDTIICENLFYPLYAPISHHDYLWTTGEHTPQITPTANGFYGLLASDEHGCKSSDSIEISSFTPPVFDMADTLSNCDDHIVLTAPIGMNSYLWNDGSTALEYQVTSYGIVTLEVVDNHLCVYKKTTVINNDCPPIVYLPNAFTPDQNGLNDVFIPVMHQIKQFELIIYDRWGNEVFRTHEKEVGWDGKKGNDYWPMGVYFYQLVYLTFQDEAGALRGNVTLLR